MTRIQLDRWFGGEVLPWQFEMSREVRKYFEDMMAPVHFMDAETAVKTFRDLAEYVNTTCPASPEKSMSMNALRKSMAMCPLLGASRLIHPEQWLMAMGEAMTWAVESVKHGHFELAKE